MKDESGGSDIFAIAEDVAHNLRSPGFTRAAIEPVVYDAACQMPGSRFKDFIKITECAAPGTTYQIRLSFLFDAFRLDLANAAKKRLLVHKANPSHEVDRFALQRICWGQRSYPVSDLVSKRTGKSKGLRSLPGALCLYHILKVRIKPAHQRVVPPSAPRQRVSSK